MLFADQRDPAAAAGSGVSLGTNKVVPHGWCVIIDRPGEGLEVEARPRRSRSHALAQEKIGAVPGVLERLHVAHGFCHIIEDGLGFLAITEARQ